jgi:hypothetical protein
VLPAPAGEEAEQQEHEYDDQDDVEQAHLSAPPFSLDLFLPEMVKDQTG